MSHEHENEHEDHDHDHDHDEAFDLGLPAQGQIFLEMRQQNLELLQIACKVAGYGGEHGPVKHGDLKNALRSIWDIYSEFYAWVDPEEGDEEEGEDDDEG